MENYFKLLNDINVNDHTEQKNKLTYLSWAWAWAEVKKMFPDAIYTVYENADGWNYHTDGRTCWVKTGVTVNGIEHIEYLPVMDFRNASIPTDKVTSYDVNKAIQRSLTKACARHGLGLYIYAGEDLPESEADDAQKTADPPKKKPAAIPAIPQDMGAKPGWRIPPVNDIPVTCQGCQRRIGDYFDGKELIKAEALAKRSLKKYDVILCYKCAKEQDAADAKDKAVKANAESNG